MAPSQIKIAISSLQRLLKDEHSYFKEQEQQEVRINKLVNQANGNDENYEYQLRQEVGHVAETPCCENDYRPSCHTDAVQAH